MADVQVVVAGGNLYLFTPLTEVAREWIEENVSDDALYWGASSLVVESRYARDLAAGMQADGLVVT